MKKVSNDDTGGGRIYKIWHVCGDVIFEWFLMRIASTLIQPPPKKIQVKCQSIITNEFQKTEAIRGRFRKPSYTEDEIFC